jgi:hypothetical protein
VPFFALRGTQRGEFVFAPRGRKEDKKITLVYSSHRVWQCDVPTFLKVLAT